MNGIIHNCTHKDAGEDVSFRLSEEEMFIRIFNYIEHLFGKIKPKQLFFMAIDGVAPRAKMNQQRSRRFRTALDAEKARDKAIKDGIEIPKEEPFDSNCITPGLFMIFVPPARDANIGRYRFYGKAIPTVEVLCQQEGF
jgi:5'-3' exoribonuclease 1